jgi:AcrR family transcriptional regulator
MRRQQVARKKMDIYMSDSTAITRERPTRNAAQRQAILEEACLLFISKGFGGTNMQDIADAAGLTRTAVYHYFSSKEAMLEALTEDVTQKASQLSASISKRDDLPADEALQQLIIQHAGLILSLPLQFRVVERSESSLPEGHRKAAEDARRALLAHFVHVIQRGIREGVFRPIDAHVAAFSLIGMCNWCAWWFDPGREVSARDVATSIAELGIRGLQRVKAQRVRPVSIEETMSQMRDAMAVLERQVGHITTGADKI